MPKKPTNDVLKARVEASELLGFGDDPQRLCIADRLRVDLVVSLRAAIDRASASLLDDGSNSSDLARLVNAVEYLTKLLPERQLAAPAEQRDDRDAAVAPLLRLFRHLHESVHTLSAENAHLKAALRAGAVPIPPDVPMADVVPPGEIGVAYAGMQHGPDDPPRRSSRVIEGTVAPAPKSPSERASPQSSAAPQYDYDRERGWRDHVLPDGNITPTPMSRGRWWGPV
jgi:hypothetical protein